MFRIKAVDMDEGSLDGWWDVAIYYGRGNWPGLRADSLYQEYLIPLVSTFSVTGDKAIRILQDEICHAIAWHVS